MFMGMMFVDVSGCLFTLMLGDLVACCVLGIQNAIVIVPWRLLCDCAYVGENRVRAKRARRF